MAAVTRRTREQARRLRRLSEAQAALGWGVILILIALLGTVYLRQSSHTATIGRRVQILQDDLDRLKLENADIERRIAEAQSLERLQNRALTLGFQPAHPDDVEYLVVPNYPTETAEPMTILNPPQPTPTAVPIETMSEAIWLTLSNRVNSLIRGEASEQ